MPAPADRGELKSTTYEVFILAVSIFSIANMVLLAIFEWESQYWWLVYEVDIALTIVFVSDFLYRLKTAPSKRRYLWRGRGILDLLACFPGLRIFRVFRIVRAVRVFRRLGGPKVLGDLRSELASGTLYLIIFFGFLTLEVIGLLELRFELHAQGSNIHSGGDALWWGYVTATTVGYGDYFPVSTGGRIAGVVMLTVGVALFATFSGFLANLFLSKRDRRVPPQAQNVEDALREVERLLAEQQRATEALRARLLELEGA